MKRRKRVYRNLARTEKYFIKNIRVSFAKATGMYDPSSVWENFHYIRPRFRYLPFKKHSIFKNDLNRRLKGYGLARLSKASYFGDVSLGIFYIYPEKVYTLKGNLRKLRGEPAYIRLDKKKDDTLS